MKQLTLAVLFVFTLAIHEADAQNEKPIPFGKILLSPNGRFSVNLVLKPSPREFGLHLTDKTPCLEIKDNQNGTIFLAGILFPVFLIEWIKNSNAFVTIEHVAGGTQTALLSYNEGQWKRYEIHPLEDDQSGHYAVVKLTVRGNKIFVKYKVADNSEGNRHVHFYVRDFAVDASSGEIMEKSNVHNITSKEYIHTVLHNKTGEDSIRTEVK